MTDVALASTVEYISSTGTIIVSLSCALCPATVVHTDVVPLSTVSAYLSASGWQMTELGTTGEQSALCPRCALAGGHRG